MRFFALLIFFIWKIVPLVGGSGVVNKIAHPDQMDWILGIKPHPNEEEGIKKVALLFQIRHNLKHVEFWKNYLKDHLDLFNIYIHSDNPPDDPFFNAFRIDKVVPATWDFHVNAERALIIEAVKDPNNCKFILISESCLPLVNAETMYARLIADELSYFYYAKPWWSSTQRWRNISELPEKHRWGNHEWFTLNRKHALICALDEKTTKYITRHPIDSESFPSCLLSVNNCLQEVVNFGFTYVDWSRTEANGAHPYMFRIPNEGDLTLLRQAREAGHLFARKFDIEYPEEALQAFIEETRAAD